MQQTDSDDNFLKRDKGEGRRTFFQFSVRQKTIGNSGGLFSFSLIASDKSNLSLLSFHPLEHLLAESTNRRDSRSWFEYFSADATTAIASQQKLQEVAGRERQSALLRILNDNDGFLYLILSDWYWSIDPRALEVLFGKILRRRT